MRSGIKSFLEEKKSTTCRHSWCRCYGSELAGEFQASRLRRDFNRSIATSRFLRIQKLLNLVYDKLLKEGLAVHLETRVTGIRDKGREIVLSGWLRPFCRYANFAVGVSPNN